MDKTYARLFFWGRTLLLMYVLVFFFRSFYPMLPLVIELLGDYCYTMDMVLYSRWLNSLINLGAVVGLACLILCQYLGKGAFEYRFRGMDRILASFMFLEYGVIMSLAVFSAMTPEPQPLYVGLLQFLFIGQILLIGLANVVWAWGLWHARGGLVLAASVGVIVLGNLMMPPPNAPEFQAPFSTMTEDGAAFPFEVEGEVPAFNADMDIPETDDDAIAIDTVPDKMLSEDLSEQSLPDELPEAIFPEEMPHPVLSEEIPTDITLLREGPDLSDAPLPTYRSFFPIWFLLFLVYSWMRYSRSLWPSGMTVPKTNVVTDADLNPLPEAQHEEETMRP